MTLSRLCLTSLLLAAVAAPASAEIQFAIGEPAEGGVYSGIGQIAGWAVSDEKIVSVEAFIDGNSLGPVPYGGGRGDVAAAFPDLPDAEYSGWAMKWNYALLAEGEHVLTIVVTEADGDEAVKDVVFNVTGFRSEFIADPNAIDISDAVITPIGNGRILIEGAWVEGEQVDIEMVWTRAAQQFLIDKVTYYEPRKSNEAPQAWAGVSMTAEPGARVVVSGSGTDADGFIENKFWQQISGPQVELSNADDWDVSFVAPGEETQIELRLTVTDNEGATDTDKVRIDVQVSPPPNQSPTANAGADRTVETGSSVVINGNGSDPDGSISSWSWTQISGPAVSLAGADTSQVQFTAPDAASTISLRLTVTDDDGADGDDEVTIMVEPPPPPENKSPTAEAGPDLLVEQGENVVITGTGSDPDGEIVSWFWAVVSGPSASLSGADTPTVSFTAPSTEGDMVLRLTVTDNFGATGADTVIVTVEEPPKPDTTTGQKLPSMLQFVNDARGQARDCGSESFEAQPPFSWSESLAEIAMIHSMDMAREGYFDHTSKDGTSMGDRVFPYWNGTRVGENIAASSGDLSLSQVVQMWLDSPGHCALIMDPDFTHVGAGSGQNPENGYTYHYFWTLNFGG